MSDGEPMVAGWAGDARFARAQAIDRVCPACSGDCASEAVVVGVPTFRGPFERAHSIHLADAPGMGARLKRKCEEARAERGVHVGWPVVV